MSEYHDDDAAQPADILHSVRLIYRFLSDEPATLPKADAIFAFGYPSDGTPRHAAKLFHQGLAPLVVVTGYKGLRGDLPAGYKSQAEMFSAVLRENGVPAQHIIMEKQSTHTLENVLFGMGVMEDIGIRPDKLILCAMKPHLLRTRATFAKQFPAVKTFGSGVEIPESELLTPHRMARLIGEVERLERYARRGDIAQVEIPARILAACRTIQGTGIESI